VLKLKKSNIAKAQIKYQTSTKFLKILERIGKLLGKTLTSTNNKEYISTKNLALAVSLVKDFQNTASIYSIRSNKEQASVFINESIPNDSLQSKIIIPTSNFIDKNTAFVIAINYKNGIFFSPQADLENLVNGVRNIRGIVGSNVLSATINDRNNAGNNLLEPISIGFKNVSQSKGTGTCKFWNFSCPGNFFSAFLTSGDTHCSTISI